MKTLLRKREKLLRDMKSYVDFLRGSITSVCSTCNRATCICPGELTKRAYRLTYKDAEQKTRTVYISRAQLPAARRMLKNYARMRNLTEKLFAINIAIFKRRS
jgi:hypothetical protein